MSGLVIELMNLAAVLVSPFTSSDDGVPLTLLTFSLLLAESHSTTLALNVAAASDAP